ncbi:MAG: hypothetical protein ND895_19765 [Pyrinomonadaceae bacterium]|nr:hypothetical protein [Pyrinomonadaceae bacterium]
MPRSSKKKKSSAGQLAEASALSTLDPLRTGMPAMDSILSIRTLETSEAKAVAESLNLTSYRIIRTNEVDAYEKAAKSMETLNAALAAAEAAPVGDAFKGTARKAAKLSIANAPTKTFTDLKTLVNSLPKHEDMLKLKIKTTATSDRVAQEKHNVRGKVFLYAASREDDRDFHLILGRDPDSSPEVYMTMELSGLPPESKPSFAKLKAARDAFKAFFGADLPGLSYDFYDPPIPVRIEGSLFWDASHAKGSRPGPKSLKSRMPVVWEVHPITKITFNP